MSGGSFAEQLSALMAYRNRPEGEPEPLQTNWTVVAANDIADPEEVADFGFERNLLVTPSVKEIMYQAKSKPDRNEAGQVVGIGKLRFSDGTQMERGYAIGPDGTVIQSEFRMRAGAMLHTVEKAKQQAGGKGYTQAQLEQSNLYFAALLKTVEPRYVPRTKRRNGVSLSAEQSRAVLVEAIANTRVMPKVTKLKPGLPCGAPRVADSFLGFQKGKKGESGAIMWQDMCTSIVNREIWDETLASMREEDKAALDMTLEAKTLADLGSNGHRRTQERQGLRKLRAANDNLAAALKKSAA